MEIGLEISVAFPILVDVAISQFYSESWANFPIWIVKLGPVNITLPSPIRYLRLWGVGTPWVSGHFRNLVEFFLHDQPTTSPDPSMKVFLGILEASPQLAILSVANAGPRLRYDTRTLPPATGIVHLRNLHKLYLEQADVGWILIHLKIPISASVRLFADLRSGVSRLCVPIEYVLDLALPSHPGFQHLTDFHHCTYGVRLPPACLIIAPNFAIKILWTILPCELFEHFMLPFPRRVAGTLKDFRIVSGLWMNSSTPMWDWDQAFDTLGSLQQLRVESLNGGFDPFNLGFGP